MQKSPVQSDPNSPLSHGALEAPEEVQGMFTRIARRYDFANALLSGGLDIIWRKNAARVVARWQPERLLDLATGSGVFAGALSRACPRTEVIGADFCVPMLARARATHRLRHPVAADALRLPFADHTFDAVTVAFGLRNMASYDAALRESRRILRPGGHLLILDFSLPRHWWSGLYRAYLHLCLPTVAGILSGERGAYRYLAKSIERFPSGREMCALLTGAGFSDPEVKELTGGIVSLYTAEAAGR